MVNTRIIYEGPDPTLIGAKAYTEEPILIGGCVLDRYSEEIREYQELTGDPKDRVLNLEKIERLGKIPVEVSLDNGITMLTPICHVTLDD